MSWGKREAMTNLVILGDGPDNKRKVGGLLLATPFDRAYPDKMNYIIVQKDGEELVLSGSASLSRQLSPADVGKFVKCEFTGWGKSANGKYKVIEVNVWEGEANDDMKAWPRYAEFNTSKKLPTPAAAKGTTSAADTWEDFEQHHDDPRGQKLETDDLPF